VSGARHPPPVGIVAELEVVDALVGEVGRVVSTGLERRAAGEATDERGAHEVGRDALGGRRRGDEGVEAGHVLP
jgi:hypothetical protein